MKKILIISMAFITLISCTKNFEKMNTNPKEATNVPGEYLFTSAQKNLVDIITSANINENVFRLFSQYWAQTTYFDESRYDLVTRDISQNFWTPLYRDVLRDLSAAKENIKTDPLITNADIRANQLATCDILECYAYYALLTTFGNVPYSQAVNISYLQPIYDDGITVHNALINRLTKNINTLEASKEGHGFSGADQFYGGDNSGWIKFAATLKMKLAILMADVAGQSANASAAFAEAAPMAFQSSADDAVFHYLGTTPNNNPIADDLNPALTKRKDFVAANTIVDYMNERNDPRRAYYFTMVGGEYIGGIYGTSNAYSAFSKVNSSIYALDAPSTLMGYVDVLFMMAEAAERGWMVAGTAEDYYHDAIRTSILNWGGTEMEANDYIADTMVNYNTAMGTWKQKIGMQSWLAMYNRGLDGFTSWRHFDAPILNIPPQMTAADLPVRFTYPINEQTLNAANYSNASSAIGGDLKSTKLYWDK